MPDTPLKITPPKGKVSRPKNTQDPKKALAQKTLSNQSKGRVPKERVSKGQTPRGRVPKERVSKGQTPRGRVPKGQVPEKVAQSQKVALPTLSFFRERYLKTIRPEMQKKFGYKNLHQVPSLVKVVLNMGIGDASRVKGKAEKACQDMTLIAGQKAIITRARCSVATFKLRTGMPAGVKVTLRKRKMYEFLERMIYIVLPSVRDFRGLSVKSFDQNGNYSFGIKEHIVFPEINYDHVDSTRGLDVTVCTTAQNHKEAKSLLENFMFPFLGESRE